MFIDQPTVTFCLFRKLHELSQGSFGRKLFEDNKFDSNYFLKWAYSLNPIIGTIDINDYTDFNINYKTRVTSMQIINSIVSL
jgi:hypothetical protein